MQCVAGLVLTLGGVFAVNSPAFGQYFHGYAGGLPGRAGWVRPPVYYPVPTAYGSFGDPYGGYLSGAAQVINAQGGYLKDVQQAYLMKEQASQAKIQTKRAAFDEWMYERANTPTLEEQRENERLQNVLRSRNVPPATEIWSGKALNDILQDLQQRGPGAMAGPPIYLNQELLKEVNVTVGTTTAGLGVLKNDGKLEWPLALTQAQKGAVNPKTLNDLIAAVNKLSAQLKDNAANIEPNQYIRSKRYLNDLNGSLVTLQDPNATKYFSKQYVAQGNTVAELVQFMTAQGLKFAPATPGDEAAYNMLQRALADYDAAVAPNIPRGR
jgi:hypothetical protein